MEEYGLIIVAILVVAALVGLTVAFNKKSSTNANKAVDDFNNKAQSYINSNGEKIDNGSTTTDQGGTK